MQTALFAALRLQAQEHGHLPTPLLYITALLVGAAFLRPVPRVAGFILGGAAAVTLYGRQLLSWVMVAELALYVSGAALFLRNQGHGRWAGWADHHLLVSAQQAGSVPESVSERWLRGARLNALSLAE